MATQNQCVLWHRVREQVACLGSRCFIVTRTSTFGSKVPIEVSGLVCVQVISGFLGQGLTAGVQAKLNGFAKVVAEVLSAGSADSYKLFREVRPMTISQ